MAMMGKKLAGILAAVLFVGGAAGADTFTDYAAGEALHGYISGRTADGVMIAQTPEKGQVELNPAKYSVVRDREGRKNSVVLLTIDGSIELECQTKALVDAIAKASSQGPQFILIEMDTPGGRLDLAKEICAAIDAADCDVAVFVKGGKHGGAISAGAAVALACNRIYIARNAVIGGATVVSMQDGRIADVRRVAGEDVGEKITSIWRGSMASMAEKRGRSGLMAQAMVDRRIEVTEITRQQARMFVEPQEVQASDVVVKKWSDRGKLVTLTGEEAVKCGMADAIAESRQDVLKDMNSVDAQITEDRSAQAAVEQFELMEKRSDMLVRNINAKIGRLRATQTRAAGLKLIREIQTDMGTLVMLGKANPDLNLDVEEMQNEYAQVKAYYEQAVRN